MNIIPAIDLYNQQCVRLAQGKFDAVTQYAIDPITYAKECEKNGARQLHIVDLNGAQDGTSQQIDIIHDIQKNCNLTLQVGGGLRTEKHITTLLNSGIERVIIGSLAVTNPELMTTLIERFGAERFVLALDVSIKEQPFIVIKGWTKVSAIGLWDYLKKNSAYENINILCTDIDRDGMMTGPNTNLYTECVQRYPNLRFQASGGISSLSDLKKLKQIGIDAVIIGKALYEKKFSLTEALAC